jgi:serine/threonine protein kinase
MNTIPRKLGRYAIIREIGRGAMGVVYKAHDPIIEREVAIKAIKIAFDVPPEEKDVYLSRFFREAKAAGKLNHPNIVTIFDVDEDKETGTPFIVMEFLEGTTISEVMSSGVLLPLDDVNNMILQLADALNYAHSEGVVHRDIKAANILIMPGMKVKIMDFGIARLPSSDLTQSGQFIGTPNYMSPEQIEGKTVDGRSDLFSLGVIFYMLLTGERPFTGDSFNTVSYRIVNVEHVPPRTLNPNVPDRYNGMLTKLLAKDPGDRYQTGSELVNDLKRLMANMPDIEELQEDIIEATVVGDPPPPLPEPRPVRMERAPEQDLTKSSENMPSSSVGTHKSVTAMVAVIVLVLTLAGGAIYFIRATSQKRQLASQPPPGPASGVEPGSVAALSKQNTLRIKWDLAMKYMENGSYDQSVHELDDILKIDPSNEDARKLLKLVQEKKLEGERKKAPPATPIAAQPLAAKPIAKNRKAVEPVPEVINAKTATVNFEFEHGFPSGSVYIFTNEKLAYEGALSGEEKKVLMFRNYKGKLTGSFQVPLGETVLLVHVVCKEKDVSASQKLTVHVTSADQAHSLRIKYLKSPKQLDLQWT